MKLHIMSGAYIAHTPYRCIHLLSMPSPEHAYPHNLLHHQMLGTSTWFEDRQPSHNETTNYNSNYNSGQEMFWNADKLTGLSASTSKVEKLRLCNVLMQTSVPIGYPGYACDGTAVSYNKELTASSHLVSSDSNLAGPHSISMLNVYHDS